LASDAEVVKSLLCSGWADALLRVFQDQMDAGIVAPRLVFPTGHIQSAGGIFDARKQPWHRYLGWSNPTDRRINSVEKISWATGAALMVRREDFIACGGLDEAAYPGGYWEDVDFCLKMRFGLGKAIYYCPAATLVHEVGSTGGNPLFMQNMRTFHRRWDEQIEPDTPFVYAPW